MRLIGPIAAGIALVVCSVGVAPAEPHSGVDSQLYRQSFDPNGIYFLEGAELLPKHDFSMKLGVGFHQNPMRLAVPGIGGQDDLNEDVVLKFALALHITMSFAITEKLQIGIDAGMYRTDPDEGYGERGRYADQGSQTSTGLLTLRPLSNIDPSGGFEPQGLAGPLDARIGLKYRLVGDERSKLAVSALATAHIPFGDEEMFLGDSSFVLEPRVAIDYKFDPLSKTKVVANVGARFRERTVLESYDTSPALQLTENDAQPIFDMGSELVLGAGINYEALPEVIIGAEVVFFSPLPSGASFGSCNLNDTSRCSAIDDMDYFNEVGYGDTAGFFTGGVNYRATADTTLIVAGGAGILGVRRSDFGIMGGVAWTPTPKGARTIGRGDSDGDDNPDSTDICPDEPEDKDGYQDEDGCPELDNDGDGIIDENDKCPDEPEDKDGNEDDDGCPERDNDGDNIPDVTDRCPDDKEDIDQFEDDDGCPEDDNDGDGFADADDKCPNEKETINGIEDDDGCPDERPDTGPVEANDRINLRGNQIVFTKNNALTAPSKTILDQVAAIMIKRNLTISVEVHVALGTKSKNKRTIAAQKKKDKTKSQKRANAIVKYRVSKGVAGNAAQGVGLGSARPLGNNPPTDKLNERVNFIKKVQGGNP
jgi:hypothetical protein